MHNIIVGKLWIDQVPVGTVLPGPGGLEEPCPPGAHDGKLCFPTGVGKASWSLPWLFPRPGAGGGGW